jgi:hypothetical protein
MQGPVDADGTDRAAAVPLEGVGFLTAGFVAPAPGGGARCACAESKTANASNTAATRSMTIPDE